jgi:signal-transduction protein with cAMP-binding, CBS, and nucleotidyltransferase domain
MRKQITSLIEESVITVELNDTVETVEQTLDSHQLSCVPVINTQGECFGVISAPDLVHFHNARKNPIAERAWEMCTHKIIEVSSDISVREAAELMVKNNIHHLVVVEDGSMTGIVSSIDILRGCFLPERM